MKSQWEKFKHRTLTKVFLGYAVVAWVLIQVIEAVLPTFETPLWVAQTITFLLILGFPIAILVGWASEKLPTSSTSTEQENTPQLVHETPRRTLLWIGVGSCVVVGLFGFYMMPFIFDSAEFTTDAQSMPRETTNDRRGYRFELVLGETGINATTGRRSDIAISPDGNLIAYKVYMGDSSGSEIFIKDIRFDEADRSLATLTVSPNSEGMQFSDNGDWVYFNEGTTLKRIRIEGGVAQIVAEEVSQRGSSEIGPEVLYRPFANRVNSALIKVSASGGNEELIELSDGAATWPDVLPGETHALITVSNDSLNVGSGSIELLNLQSYESTPLIQNAFNAQYAGSGHIVFLRDTTLWAVPFDLDSLEIIGNEVPAVVGLESFAQRGAVSYSFSENGRLIYIQGNESSESASNRYLQWISRAGEIESIGVDIAHYGNIAISPNELELSLTLYDGINSDVWVWDFDREMLGRRTFDNNSLAALWSFDGTELLYKTNAEISSIMATASNGSSSEISILETGVGVIPRAINPYNDELILESWISGCPDLNYQNTESERLLQSMNLSPSCSAWPSISQDGNWIAYSSNETGRIEIFVRPFPDIGKGKWQVSRDGGNQALWNSEGQELFFWAESGEHMVVNYEVEETEENQKPTFIRLSNPQTMFSTTPPSLIAQTQRNAWDYSPSRDAFIVLSPRDLESTSPEAVLADQTTLKIIENWFEEIKSIAPPDPS